MKPESALRTDTIDFAQSSGVAIGSPGSMGDFRYGEMKFPDRRIGDTAFSPNPVTPPTPPPIAKPPPLPTLKPARVTVPPPIRPPTARS